MSGCNVCIGFDPGECEPCDFYHSKIVKARKEHECSECREPIRIGQKYERTALKADGELQTFETCMMCVELGDSFTCDGETVRSLGTLWNDIEENLFPQMTTGCLQKIKTAEAKAFLVKRWNAWKFRGTSERVVPRSNHSNRRGIGR